jgi:hypothetical protein
MYTSIRRYTADPNEAAAIIDIVRQSNITDVISGLPGFVAYYFVDCAKGSMDFPWSSGHLRAIL